MATGWQHYQDESVQNDDQWQDVQHPALDDPEENGPPRAFLYSDVETDVKWAPGEEHEEGDEFY